MKGITLVADDDRLDFLPKHFGARAMLHFETKVYDTAQQLCSEYKGGYWNFYEGPKGSFFMAPSSGTYDCDSPHNGWRGKVDAVTFGMICSLYAMNSVCWRFVEDRHNESYYRMKHLAATLPNAEVILGAID
jgi:hypothetical protein